MYLEDFLKLNDIRPMQTSYTQTAEDRSEQSDKGDSKSKSKSGNEPLDNDEEVETESPEKVLDEDKKDEETIN